MAQGAPRPGEGRAEGREEVRRAHGRWPLVIFAAALAVAAGARAGEGADSRIAVWGFRAAADDAEGASLGARLATLAEVELARRGAEVVERRGFHNLLKEHKLAFTQFADAEKTVRAGKLARADIVIVGSVHRSGKRHVVTTKAVETASGKVLDARVDVLAEPDLQRCAASVAAFAVAARGKNIGRRVFLAVGGFEDLSINDRFTDLGRELRGGLARAFRDDPRVRTVEREHVEPLLLELGLSRSALASLKFGGTRIAPAFLVVDGLYQSYRTEKTGIALNLRLERPGRPLEVVQMDAKPGPPLVRTAVDAIRKAVSGREVTAPPPAAGRAEAEVHFKRGREQARIRSGPRNRLWIYSGLGGFKHKGDKAQNLRNAISSFESVILLDPDHHEARFFLAACLAEPEIADYDRSRRLFEEIITRAKPGWVRLEARFNLGFTYFRACKPLLRSENPADRKKLEKGYRTAIRIWRGLHDAVECHSDKHSVLSRVYYSLDRLHERGMASAGELAKLARKLAELNCDVELERMEEVGHLSVDSFRQHWGKLHRILGDGARSECDELERKLSRKHPSLSYLLRFTLALEFGMTEENQALLADAVKEAVEGREGLAGLPGALTYVLPRAIEWHAKLERWDEAAALADRLVDFAEGNWRKHDIPHRHRAKYKMMQAFCHENAGHWRRAADIYEALGDAKVLMASLQKEIVAKRGLARCRERLRGRPPVAKIEESPVGKHMIELPGKAVGRSRVTPGVSALSLTESALWIGTRPYWARGYAAFHKEVPGLDWSGVAGLHRYDLKTGRLTGAPLADEPEARWITAIATHGRHLYVGTYGAGLFRLDLRTGAKRRWRAPDDLLSDHVSALSVRRGEILWIGFAKRNAGGCGYIDLDTGKFTGLTPLLGPKETAAPFYGTLSRDSVFKPPKHAVAAMHEGPMGGIWLAVYGKGLQLYDPREREWDTATRAGFSRRRCSGRDIGISDDRLALTCLAVGRGFAAVGAKDSRTGALHGGSVDIFDTSDNTWSHVRKGDGLPQSDIYTLASGGRMLWIGGSYYVAGYDLEAKRLTRTYSFKVGRGAVGALCPTGEDLWVGAGRWVYRIAAPGAKGVGK